MATKVAQHTTSDFMAVGNWVGGVAPITGDTLQFDQGSQVIDTNTNVSGTVNELYIKTGPQWKGQLGTSAAPLKFAGTVGTLDVNSPESQGIFIQPTATLASIKVYACGSSSYGCYLMGGTTTVFYASGGLGIRLGGSATVGSVFVLGAPQNALAVAIESGCTLSTLFEQHGGHVISEAALPATINVLGGLLEQCGTATFNMGTVTVGPGGVLVNTAYGGTITKIIGKGGIIDFSQDAHAKTLTNGDFYQGCSADFRGNIIFTNPINLYGCPPPPGVPAASLTIVVNENPYAMNRH